MKKTFVVVGVLLGVILLWWVGSAAYSGFMGWRWERQTEKFQAALSKPYREDTYGGKTPEETWSMFLDALRKGDVELASKYIVVEKREKRLGDMVKAKEEGRLPGIVEKYSVDLEDEDVGAERVSFELPYVNESGKTEAHPIVFILNPYTKVWKISLL